MEVDVKGYPCIVEILNVSIHFGVEKELLVEISKLHMKITIKDENIIMEIILILLDKKIISLIKQTQNLINNPCNNENISVLLS